MAGVRITVAVGDAPQSGTQSINCSAPTDLAGFVALSGVGPNTGFVQVTDAATASAKLIGVARILSVVAT